MPPGRTCAGGRASTWCAARTGGCWCSRTTCARRPGSPTRAPRARRSTRHCRRRRPPPALAPRTRLRPARRRAPARPAPDGSGEPSVVAALRRARQQRLVRAPRARPAPGHPARDAATTWTRRRGRLTPAAGTAAPREWTWSTGAPTRTGCATPTGSPPGWPTALLEPVRARAPGRGQRLRDRRGRRQARPRLRGGHDPLLPRRGAAAAVRPHLRPRRPGRARRDALGRDRRAGGEAAHRPRRRAASWSCAARARARTVQRIVPRHPRSARATTWPRRRCCSRATRRSARAGSQPRHVDLRAFVSPPATAPVVARRPDPRRARARVAGGELLPGRRSQGHLGAA